MIDIATVWDWAWARHGNILSWYIRPLFLIPLALAAYRRSALGIVLSVLAMLSSMFWFPAPAAPDPQVQEFLAFEQDWLLGSWSLGKVLVTAVVPLSLAAYCIAFWRRSLRWGLAVLAAIAFGKIAWSTLAGGNSGGAVAVPALVGLAVGAIVVATVVRRHRHGTVKNERGPTDSTTPASGRAGR